MARRDADQFELRGVLDTLRRRKVTIAIITVGVVVCALVFSLLQTRTYRASAEVLIEPRDMETVFDNQGNPGNPATATVETETRVLRSDPVRRAVRRAIGSVPPVSAGRIDETQVMRISATSTEAPKAAAIANAYARAYVSFRKSQAVGDLASASKSIQAKIKTLQDEIDELEERLARATGPEFASVEASVGPRYNSLIEEQGVLAQKLNSLQVDANLKSGGAQLVRNAVVPTSPATPQPVRNGILALIVGLMLGVAVAFLREHLDDSVRTKLELAEALPGIPVLGVIPSMQNWTRETGTARLTELRTSTDPTAEAYRNLRTAVQLLGIERPLRTVQVTSPVAAEGKTTLVANLATVLAAPDRRVVIVDCDLRRPTLHEVFDLNNDRGFTTLMAGGLSAAQAARRSSFDENLYLLPSGPIPPNPSELLESQRTAEVLFELQAEFDIVLVDSPPVLPVTDAVVLAAWVEATILVARSGKTTERLLTEAVERLHRVEARVAGTVLNGASAEAAYGYGARYGYAQPAAGERTP